MAKLQISYKDSDEEILYKLDKDEVTLGRSPKADLVLQDYGVSRLHAKLVRDEQGYNLVDLDSRNGTKLNSVEVKNARINKGDVITLGNFTLEIQDAEQPETEMVDLETGDDREISPESGTIIRSALELEKLLQAAEVLEDAPAPPVEDIEKSNKILRILTSVAKALISAEKLDDTLERVMDLVFDHIPAERGVLAIKNDQDKLTSRVVRYRKKKGEDEKITIPRAITNKVLSDKVSILTMDAMQDDRFDNSQSIFMLGIRSAMCVPLWEHERVIGIIYVDEDVQAGTFNTNDLDLLAALGNYAAVAIERARLTEKIQEEQAARAKLSRYHSPGVVEMIIRGEGSQDSLDMQKKEVSVSFTDLVGFTTLSEGLEPAELGHVLNEFFTEMTECIFKYEGTLDKYIGDCIMAVFGAPIDMPDHAIRCVRAGLEMHKVLAKLNEKRADLGVGFNVRTAINSGQVVAGDIGSPKRKDYSVLGDTVNVSSRLESSVAQPGQVVIGEATYVAVKDYFEVRELGAFSLKGKSIQMNAYEVLGEKPGVF
jgi:adenylate cyclase